MNWARAIKNLPLRFHEERSDQLASASKDGWRRIYLAKDVSFACPSDALVLSIWRFHAFCRGGRRELFDFLNLARECRRFMDLGASAGIFSALFANTREGAAIVSVEPDRRSHGLLLETATLNQTRNSDWRTVRAAVTDRRGRLRFHSDGFGGLVSHDESDEEIEAYGLESLAGEIGWIPEVIKIDIESFEFEVIEGAEEWLGKHRPRLFLELHWALLEERGRAPEELLDRLHRIGYRCDGRKLEPVWVKARLDASGCGRLALTWNR